VGGGGRGGPTLLHGLQGMSGAKGYYMAF